MRFDGNAECPSTHVCRRLSIDSFYGSGGKFIVGKVPGAGHNEPICPRVHNILHTICVRYKDFLGYIFQGVGALIAVTVGAVTAVAMVGARRSLYGFGVYRVWYRITCQFYDVFKEPSLS